MNKKLYRVTLRGMTHSANGVIYGISYVVADDPTSAYKIVYDDLNKRDIGFPKDRVLDKIELIAEDDKYSNCRTILYL